MSYSKEWTDWHLTPEGWVRGSERTDGVGIEEKPVPPGTVLTQRWLEEQTSPYSSMYRGLETQWTSDDKEAIQALLEKHGNCPETL
jgi:hypothetical protein